MRQPIWTRAVSEKGGGRKKLIEVSAALEENFLKVLETTALAIRCGPM